MGRSLAESIAFALTDVVGSTRLWEAAPASMRVALRRHDEIVAQLVAQHGGDLVKSKGEGDSTFSVFDDPSSALAYLLALQRGLAAEPWPSGVTIEVRSALHTGPAEHREGDYFGPTVNRCARLRGAAHGGQVLVSGATAELVRSLLPPGCGLLDLGEKRLKDLAEPERVFQLTHPDLRHDFPPLEAADAVENNLPAHPVALIGRELELAQAHELLDRSRMVTVTGPGGCGKTRLALQLATERIGRHPDGVWFVELEGLEQSELVATVVAGVLAVREELGRRPEQTLTAHLARRQVLLVLDGCERVVEGAADLCGAILRDCPHVTLICTSREFLDIRDEAVLQLLGLPVPVAAAARSSVRDNASVQLFATCVERSRRGTGLDVQELDAAAEICRSLDGIPLALELAAARCRTLPVGDVAARLDDRFQLLAGGSRDAPKHHRTLRALVDWSYEALSSEEQQLLRVVTGFATSFSLPAAEAVVQTMGLGAMDVLGGLDHLAAKSMIFADVSSNAPRYRTLSTIREYGHARRLEAGDHDRVLRAIVDHFLELASDAFPHLLGPDQKTWMDRLEADHDNFRLALQHSLVDEPTPAGARLASKLWRFWYVRGHLNEGRRWLELAEPVAGDEDSLAEVLHAAGTLAWAQGDYGTAERLLGRALDRRRGLDSTDLLAETLNNLGTVAIYAGNYRRAQQCLGESLRLAQRSGHEQSVARTRTNLGYAARLQGDHESARGHLEIARQVMDGLGDHLSIAIVDANLAAIARAQGDLATARALSTAALETAERLQGTASIPVLLTGLASIERLDGSAEEARRLADRATSLARQHRATRSLCEALVELALSSGACGDTEAGLQIVDEVLAIAGEARDRHATALAHAAAASLSVGLDHRSVRRHANEALGIRRELGEEAGVSECLELLDRVGVEEPSATT